MKVPTYQRRVSLAPPLPPAWGGEFVPVLSQALELTAGVAQRLQEKRAQQELSEKQRKAQEAYDEYLAERARDPDYRGWVERYDEWAQGTAAELLAETGSALAAERFQQWWDRQAAQWRHDAARDAIETQHRSARADAEDLLEDARRAKDAPEYLRILQENTAFFDPEELEQLRQSGLRDIAERRYFDQAIGTTIDAGVDPKTGTQWLLNPENTPELTDEERIALAGQHESYWRLRLRREREASDIQSFEAYVRLRDDWRRGALSLEDLYDFRFLMRQYPGLDKSDWNSVIRLAEENPDSEDGTLVNEAWIRHNDPHILPEEQKRWLREHTGYNQAGELELPPEFAARMSDKADDKVLDPEIEAGLLRFKDLYDRLIAEAEKDDDLTEADRLRREYRGHLKWYDEYLQEPEMRSQLKTRPEVIEQAVTNRLAPVIEADVQKWLEKLQRRILRPHEIRRGTFLAPLTEGERLQRLIQEGRLEGQEEQYAVQLGQLSEAYRRFATEELGRPPISWDQASGGQVVLYYGAVPGLPQAYVLSSGEVLFTYLEQKNDLHLRIWNRSMRQWEEPPKGILDLFRPAPLPQPRIPPPRRREPVFRPERAEEEVEAIREAQEAGEARRERIERIRRERRR